ncbi:hypothetical protein [Chryseobacterium tongliaoense]|uniref:hypothetical protein n=1 Tax=Chryseobacterium tongliaoense TaxID=3240933 RepID=UPI003518FF9E
MRKFLFFLSVLFFGMCFSQTAENLYGKWSGTDSGKKGSFTFFPDGYANVELEGMIIDGRNFIIPGGPNKGKTGHVKYTVDFSKKPFKFSLIASYNDNNNKTEESKFLNGLIEFTKENEIVFFMDFENEGSTDIDPLSPNTITLHKDSNL